MVKSRLEAFSDGVIAILITVMVLELRPPHAGSFQGLQPLLPHLLGYVLSFVNLGIYWNNHHHMFQAVKHVNGRVLWANLHLLFWLSLIPAATAWVGEHPHETSPTVLYGLILLMSGAAYTILQHFVVAAQRDHSPLELAVGIDVKGKASVVIYALGVLGATQAAWIGQVLYVVVALLWLVPDPRIERTLVGRDEA